MGPVDRRSARSAAHLSDGNLAGVEPEAHGVDEPGGQRRHRESGTGDKYDRMHFARRHLGVVEGTADHRGNAHLGVALVGEISLLEAGVLQDLVDGKDGVALAYPGAPDQPEGQRELGMAGVLSRGKLKRLLHGHDVFGHADGGLSQARHGARVPVHCATQPTLDGPSLRYMAIVVDVWCHVKPDGRYGPYGRYPGLAPPNRTTPRASPQNRPHR